MDRTNYHKILGVSQTASRVEIRRAYRQAALRWHPDKHPEDKKEAARKRFDKIKDAYEALVKKPAIGKRRRKRARDQTDEELYAAFFGLSSDTLEADAQAFRADFWANRF